MAQASNYIISNRGRDLFGNPDDSVAPNGTLTFTKAPFGRNNTSFSDISRPECMADLKAALRNAAVDGITSLCVVIHGFDTTWATIQQQAPLWFYNLVEIGGYDGVVLAFDWPSGDWFGDYWGAKDRAAQTANESLPRLNSFLLDVVTELASEGIFVATNLLCHSMGNFLLWNGASVFGYDSISQTLLVAAELSSNTFGTDPVDEYTPGGDIVNASQKITVYFSTNDDVLPWAQDVDPWHTELGLEGPDYSAVPYGNMTGVDCSALANASNAAAYGAPSIHTSYFYIPALIQEMAMTLMGQSFNFRSPVSGEAQGYALADQPGGNAVQIG